MILANSIIIKLSAGKNQQSNGNPFVFAASNHKKNG